MLNLRKKVTPQNKYTAFVNIINGVLQLSKRVAEVFSFLLIADANGFTDNVLAKEVRHTITSELGISDSNLSFYLSTLKAKSLIVRRAGKWVINDNIRPTYVEDILELVFTLTVGGEDDIL